MQQMQGLDATFVAFEQPNAPIHIGSVLIYDPSTAPVQGYFKIHQGPAAYGAGDAPAHGQGAFEY